MLSVCDELMVLLDGHLKAFGPTAEIERTKSFYRTTAPVTVDTRNGNGEL
jgi:ABC-type protease/lipase transport system fused ATPase/permease subunit